MPTRVNAQTTKKKAVILVHGMGDNKRNAMLLQVTNAIYAWMDRQKPPVRPHLDVNLTDEEGDRSTIVLKFADQQWKFVEAWWAESFDGPLFDPMVGWTFSRFIRHVRSLICSLIKNALLPTLVIIIVALSFLLASIVWLVAFLLALLLLFVTQPVLFVKRLVVNRGLNAGLEVWTTTFLAIVVAAGFFVWFLAFPESTVTEFALLAATGLALSTTQVFLSSRRRRSEDDAAPSKEANGAGRESISKGSDRPAQIQTIGALGTAALNLSGHPEDIIADDRPWHPAYFWNLILVPILGFLARPFIKWTKTVDEDVLYQRCIERERRPRERIPSGLLLLALMGFHGVNSTIMLILAFAALVMLLPLIFIAWLLSLVSAIPGIPAAAGFIKEKLDSFLVGSLGDIKVFMDEPVQAERIHGEMHEAIDAIRSDLWFHDAEIYVIAHSTGAAIAYESIVLGSQTDRFHTLRGLITVGSIMKMVSMMPSRRSGFYEELPSGVHWLNIWTRYDPALAGPISSEPPYGTEPKDVPVSNEDDPFNDHSTYFSNDHQVIPRIVQEVLGDADAGSLFDFSKEKEHERVFKRKLRILILSVVRLPALLTFPLALGLILLIGSWDSTFPPFEHEQLEWIPDDWRWLNATGYALTAAAAAQLVYKFYRAIVSELSIFRAPA